MSAWGNPPEPDWAGSDEFTCSSEVHRKFITPAMESILCSFSDEPNDPWAASRTDEQIEQLRRRMTLSRVNSLLREWARIEGMDRTCGWEGETDCYIIGSRLYWTCPACGEEHDDPADDDEPTGPDTLKEAWGEA